MASLHLGTYLELFLIVVQVRNDYKQMRGYRKFHCGVERDLNYFRVESRLFASPFKPISIFLVNPV